MQMPHLKVDLNDYLELSPASLGDLVGWFGHCPVWVAVAVVQLEVNLLNIGRDVLIAEGFEVDSPLVSVAILLSLLTEIF